MLDARDYGRSDGCNGIHSNDMPNIISKGYVSKGTDGFFRDTAGNCYNDEGKLID